ncbi:transmembrane anterior posterior transformation protein 1 homolog [Dendronephthya gigantea]|uniref:transmembrane anterior posterior transformation protein 1 homolog n=1 Tax=Dendronephthya gigantea TaxID=151771 RepID=UPI00106B1B2F|nr:transmembrane anterior posterior transformation protein 1 homolog [Dendronephthya gigantea]
MAGVTDFGNKTSEIQEGDLKEQDSENDSVSEKTLSVDKSTNIQNTDKCLLNEDTLGNSLTAGEETVTCNDTMKSFDAPTGSNPTEGNGMESSHTSVNEVNSSDINNEPTNSVPTYTGSHKKIRKRHVVCMETSKQPSSEQEFVIHHEHCENIDLCDDDAKGDLHGITDVGDHEVIDSSKYLPQNSRKDFSLFHYLRVEMTRGYLFEEQEEKYIDQREKVYTFMKTPRELEKLMWFGFLLCLDCFLFVFTYLPVRVLLAVLKLLGNVICLKFLRRGFSLLESHQICDLLRGLILLACCAAMNCLDLSILYHIVRGQSVIKLYVIYNMLDIADRLFSSIGQDTLDTLFWTAAERRHKRSLVTILLHFGLASVYVFLHAVLVLFQAITLNVAINSHNKVLMVVMVSNQFVELKGCVFKKFEKNNLFQMSCADIRERFYYVVLVSLVALRNMHELQWNLDHLYELIPSLALLLSSEMFVDWIKHAFITKFNCISSEVYREYRALLSLDATTSRLFGQRARSDHFDLVSRRLGFIPLPLGCVVYRVTSQSVQISGTAAGIVVLVLVYLWLTSVKILNSIVLLGLSSHYVMNKTTNNDETKPYMDSSPSPSDLQLPVADPLDRDQRFANKTTKTRQVKALNEIDRYTLCSNRIV